uniref:CSON008908 protein n=1 Tax=Culicoides sonorensis TaxID=179676 RepID=A0A336LZF9_CULSO
MTKTRGMTITPMRRTMTSPSKHTASKSQQRVSNFSVASLLADTSPKSQTSDMFLESKICQSTPSPVSKNDSNSTKIDIDRSQTPHSIVSDEDYDSHQENSIVDIEDINNENSISSTVENSFNVSTLNGQTPIRPTPFSALAAAAAAWSGIGGTLQWSNSRQVTSFGPPGIFNTHTFGASQLNSVRVHP